MTDRGAAGITCSDPAGTNPHKRPLRPTPIRFILPGVKAVPVALVSLLLVAGQALAGNGLNLIGFGAESVGMGGADLAVARDTTAMNTNPAGLAQIPVSRLDSFGVFAYQIEVAHRDGFGNDKEVSNRRIFLGSGGYGRRIGQGPFHMGFGIFVQGGAGNVYKDLITPNGTRDELSALFRIVKATPSVAYRASDRLLVGASLQVVYADIRQKIFPNTSIVDPGDPSRTFFGSEVKDMNGIGVGAKVGILYRVSDRLAVGAAYSSPIRLSLKGGKVVANMEAAGLGRVTYRDARIDGLELAQEAGIGISFRPIAPLLLALDLSWIDWSGSMKRSTLRATDPDTPGAPPVLEVTSNLNWRDQYVVAIGVACNATERTVLRGGYNYGRNPIPGETLNPLLATFAQHHVTLGGGYEISRKWRTDLAFEYLVNGKVTYHNPELPFGPGAQEEGETIAFHFMVSRTWE
jgi:long-chain fatty acid transport protein